MIRSEGDAADTTQILSLCSTLIAASEMMEKALDERNLVGDADLKLCWSMTTSDVGKTCGHGALNLMTAAGRTVATVDVYFNRSGQMSLDNFQWEFPASTPIIAKAADVLQRRLTTNLQS